MAREKYTMTEPFGGFTVDGTDASIIPLKVTDQLYLKALPPVIALRLETQPSEGGEIISEQWALTRGQAEFLIENLQTCLQSIP